MNTFIEDLPVKLALLTAVVPTFIWIVRHNIDFIGK